jgi:Asp-tRNA(Asn)/Glu-tRNA(Gln) amidotransferase A subunit family amidase
MGKGQRVAVALCVVVIAVFLFALQDVSITGNGIQLGLEPYSMSGLVAPALSGTMLRIFSRKLLALSFDLFFISLTDLLRYLPPLRRKLLNDNHMEQIRELAAQINIPPMYYPLYRPNTDEIEESYRLANASQSLLSRDADKYSFPAIAGAAAGSAKYHSVLDFARVYRNQSQKPSEVIRRSIKAVRQFKGAGLTIFSSLIEADVIQQAIASDLRHEAGQPLSLLDGVPIAFKDMMDVEHHLVCNGQHPKKCIQTLSDDPIVQRLREAGAIIFGITHMTEGGVTPLGFNAHYQGPFSPYSRNHYSGGSSSGSAVAVATGIVPIAIGFDGGGSIRIPASMSGIHGLGTTFGRVPFNNRTVSTMIKSGPMTTNAFDAGVVFETISPPLQGHFYSQLYGQSATFPAPHTHGFDEIQDLSDVRLGIYPEWFEDADPTVVTACYKAIHALEARGAQLVNISIPHLQVMSVSHGIKIITEFALGFDLDYHSAFDLLEPNTQITISLAKSLTALEVLSAETVRAWSFHYTRSLFSEYNLTAIVNPTIGVVPPVLSAEARTDGENNTPLVIKLLKYIFLGNFLGMPGYSVPIGYSPTVPPLPIGIHLLGNHWTEHKLLRLGHALDDLLGRHRQVPSEFFVDILHKPKTIADWKRSRNGGIISEAEDEDKFIEINVPPGTATGEVKE